MKVYLEALFSLVQIFVAMQPKESVYFANPGEKGVFNKAFHFHWADFNNNPINEWYTFIKKIFIYSNGTYANWLLYDCRY